MHGAELGMFAFISVAILLVVYFFLITEKIDKVIVAMLGAASLIFLQVFKTADHSSQTGAFEFISHNLDVLGFIIGMMILVGIVRESGAFEALAIGLVKKVKGKPTALLVALGYLTLVMTAFLSNIPTILILIPVVLVLIKTLKLPFLPFLMMVITMANIGGAMTPISDPTTYYQAKTVGLSFMEVVSNSGLIVIVLSVVVSIYFSLIFRKQLQAVKVKPEDVAAFDPKAAIKDRKMLVVGLPMLFVAIGLMVAKEYIGKATGVTLDNASIALGMAFLAMLIFNRKPKQVFTEIVDWDIIFFFMGLFIVVGSLEHTGVVAWIADFLVKLSGGNDSILTYFMTVGSGLISVFIDNVPYNITMVGAIQVMEKSGLYVYPLWWALNLGTSIGGAGSPIGAACNVVAVGQAEKDGNHVNFMKYLAYGVPLVFINGCVAFGIIYVHYLMGKH